MSIKFQKFQSDRNRQHYFRIVSAGNNEPIAQSEGYVHAVDRDHAIKLIQQGAGPAPVEESRG